MPNSSTNAQRQHDVGRRTLRVIDIVASWTVNTFYNYLHEEAVTRHSQGRANSITDGYSQILKAYLETFAHHEGYSKNVISLHKYYCDAEKQAMLALDEWIREILGEFIPDDYKSIMTNNQRYDVLRNILISAIEQFSSVLITGPMFDTLISNHDEPSIVPRMKEVMRGMLLDERRKMFARIHRASTNSDPTVVAGSNMKSEIYRLAEENVLLKNKNGKLVIQVKKAVDGMKARDRVINTLNGDLRKMQEKMMQLRAQFSGPTELSNVSAMLPPPKMPADDFKSSLRSVATSHGFPVLEPMSAPVPATVPHTTKTLTYSDREFANAPNVSVMNKLTPAKPLPLSHVENTPETFAMADPIDDSIPEDDENVPSADLTSGQEHLEHVTGSDTLALNMDEFMNN